LKLFQEWGEGQIKDNGGRGEFRYDIFQYIVRTFVSVIMYPYPAQQ
jgi:hypothetical protein